MDLRCRLRAAEGERDLARAARRLKATVAPWYLQACSAVSGDGIYEGLDWLHGSLSKRKAQSMIAAAA